MAVLDKQQIRRKVRINVEQVTYVYNFSVNELPLEV